MTEIEQPSQNGIDLTAVEDEENSKARPADIEQDMREMERRKRVEAIMGSKLFREELERIVDCARDSGNAAGILQHLSDIVGLPSSRIGSVFKTSTCMLPINDIRGVESMGYAKGEKILRCKLAATFRLLDLYGWTQGLGAQITARLKVDQEFFLVNPYGLLHHEITASSLNKVDMQGNIVEQGTTNFGVNKSHFALHSVVHAARPDIRCAVYIGCTAVVAISSLKTGLLPLTKDACILGELAIHSYTGYLNDEEERNKLVRNLGPNSKVMLLTNHGALCCGETIEEAFFSACHIVQACETQLKLLPVGLDNLVLIPDESRKIIYDQSRRPPEDLEKKFAAATLVDTKSEEEKTEIVDNTTKAIGQAPKWRVGGAEFEALMRMLDNAGYRTGYIYRHPLIKSEPPKPKNDVELPPAVSSLGYLLEEEELFRQGIWKKGEMRKGGDRSRWLNSPNVYQKVEVLETGTPDPKKITKWVAEGSPTHSTPVRIDDPLQFVPVNTNPKEFKRLQQQIKDNRRADKISAGPQSHILEGVTWDEANRIKDATVSSAGDHVVLMGAASKGIIQRGFQHNATVYKAPYAKNPFDNVTDDELNEYKRTVERKKKSIHGEYTDTDFSESEPLSSLQTSGAQQQTKQTTTTTAAVSHSEPEDISEHQVMRIQTEQAPVPSQAEVVLSDDVPFLIKTYQDPKTQQSFALTCHSSSINQHQSNTECDEVGKEEEEELQLTNNQKENSNMHNPNNSNVKLIKELEQNVLFQNKKEKMFHTHLHTYTYIQKHDYEHQGNGNLSNFSSLYDSKDVNKFSDSPCEYDENLCSNIRYWELVKKNFQVCCTPKICDKTLKSVLKPKSSKNQSPIIRDQIATSNITLDLCNARTYEKSNLPYRTLSHFGYNKPMRDPKPNHKHLAFKMEKELKYVPLRRSVSYEDIFSSPRYLNLCESCFESIVRLKPHLMKCKTKLHNLIRFGDKSLLQFISEKKYPRGTTNKLCLFNDSGDLSERDSILELNESYSTINKDDDESIRPAITNSTFNENNTRLNYSDLTSKKKSHKFLSSPNNICEFEDCFVETPHLDKKKSYDDVVDFACCGKNKNSQTYIYADDNVCDILENQLQKTKVQNCEFFENTVNIRELEENSKKLMNREERSRRKLEFQELWEDHVNFAGQLENDIILPIMQRQENKWDNNADPRKHMEQNIVLDANKEVLNERNSDFSLTKEDVEEFKSTLSHITFHSSQRSKPKKNKRTLASDRHHHLLKYSNREWESPKFENNVFDDNAIESVQNDSENGFHRNFTESSENTETFSILEKTILEKIHNNDLNKSDEIFSKIENTIRNKVTPLQLELKIKGHANMSTSKNNSNDEKENILSNPHNIFDEMVESLPQSSPSLSSFKRNSSTPLSKLSKSETNGSNNEPLSTMSRHIKKSFLKKNKKCRNFILENIRNVSVPRQSPQKIEKKRTLSSARILEHKNGNIITPLNSSSSAVYSFESKLVRGSPRFWISMYHRPIQKDRQAPSPANVKTISSSSEERIKSPVNSTLATTSVERKTLNNVDAEIDALGDEIQQIQPRLENYKRKLDDFGNRVADCVNNINECVTTQENIRSVQRKLKDCIKLREYTEEIMCRVQTFSLSETED